MIFLKEETTVRRCDNCLDPNTTNIPASRYALVKNSSSSSGAVKLWFDDAGVMNQRRFLKTWHSLPLA